MLNISVTIPDPEADGKYVPLAKDQCRKFAREFAGVYISRSFVLGTATILMEVWTPTQARITIRSAPPYMESGIQDLLSFMAGEEPTYLAAKVMFTPRVEALTAKRTQYVLNATGRRVTSGADSWSGAGGEASAKLKTISAPIGTQGNTKTFTKDVPTYFEPTKILRHKLMRDRFPPSLFTGKLQLYVQALYGSDRDDYRQSIYDRFEVNTGSFTVWKGPEPNPEFVPQPIYVELTYGYPTTGLFTVGDGTYLMVHIGIDGVTYRKMMPRGTAHVHSAEHEAHLLADLVPSSVVNTATGEGLGAGYPIYYGWHFNKSGHEAMVVLGQSESIAGVRTYDFSPTTASGLRLTHYKMSLTYDREKKQLSFSIAAVEAGLHLPTVQNKVFFPATGRNGMELLITSGVSSLNCYAELGPTPIYCYYDEADVPVVVRVSNGSVKYVAGYETGADTHNGAEGLTGSPTVTTGAWYSESFPGSYLEGASKVESAKFSFGQPGRFSPGNTTHQSTSLGPGRTVNFLFGSPPRNVYVTYLATGLGPEGLGSQYNIVIKTGESDSCVAVLAIPFGDASAVIAGQQKKIGGTFGGRYEYAFGNNIVLSTDWYEAFPQSPPLWNGVGGGTLSWGARPEFLGPDVRFKTNGDNSISASLTLYCRAGAIPLSSHTGSSVDPSEGFAARPYQSLFEPSVISSPAYGRLMRVSSSYFGAVRHDACFNDSLISGFEGGWPVGADTPVGWA